MPFCWFCREAAQILKGFTAIRAAEKRPGLFNLYHSFQVHNCIYLPVHAFKEVFACVRAFTSAGQMLHNCKQLTDSADQNAYSSTVYEFDGSSVAWNDIEQVKCYNK